MRPVGPILVLLAGLVLGWIALAADGPTFDARTAPEVPENVPAALVADVPEGHVVRTFDVDGICCEGCVGKLYVAVDHLDGVVAAAVDPARKQVETVVPRDYDVAALENALTFDKYSAHLAKSSPE